MEGYWSNIASVESYYKTNMDFLDKDIRNFFFREHPEIYTKVDDLPPAKYNPGANVKNSLVSSGCIINGAVENSIENCIVESRDTIRANTTYIGKPDDVKIVIEKNERYTI